jgi:hypothetical protein
MLQTVGPALFGVVLAYSGVSFAFQTLTCPSINSIKNEGLNGVSEFLGSYFAYHNSQYDSQRPWCFVLMPFDTKTADEAIQQANTYLPKLSGNPTPSYTDSLGNAICNYDDIQIGAHRLFAYAGTKPC